MKIKDTMHTIKLGREIKRKFVLNVTLLFKESLDSENLSTCRDSGLLNAPIIRADMRKKGTLVIPVKTGSNLISLSNKQTIQSIAIRIIPKPKNLLNNFFKLIPFLKNH